jgi:7-cyano-7-deazaguanine synthase in queuosine biosynthesis
MSRRVVVWSGGADATYSSIQNPVHAITVDYYPQLDKKFMAAQRAAKFEMEKKNPWSPFFEGEKK